MAATWRWRQQTPPPGFISVSFHFWLAPMSIRIIRLRTESHTMRINQVNCTAAIRCVTVVILCFACVMLVYVAVSQHRLLNALEIIQIDRQSANSSPERTTERPVYNLMEEKYGNQWITNRERYFSTADCTIDYANANRLQQDHPCLIDLIEKNYLHKPAARSAPYHLDNYLMVSKGVDPSDGQSQAILRILRNQTSGFFIESGANDGEYHSNTLYMERYLNWTGLLVEPDINAFKRLITRNRKAFTLNGCVSTKPYPIKVYFNVTDSPRSYIVDELNSIDKDKKVDSSNQPMVNEVQCFPLYSILLAIGRTQIDFFSLDVEGAEYKVLSTIPWHKVDMTTLTVERNSWSEEGEPAMTRLMENNKFVKFGFIELDYTRDVVYVKDFLSDFRHLYEDMVVV